MDQDDIVQSDPDFSEPQNDSEDESELEAELEAELENEPDDELDNELGYELDDITPDTTETVTAAHVVDADGYIRVGKQPYRPQQQIALAPQDRMLDLLKKRVARCLFRERRTFGRDQETEDDIRRRLLDMAISTMDLRDDEDHVGRTCDYTGTTLSWDGGPNCLSVEAVYPFCKSMSGLANHVIPNVAMIPHTLNMMKKNYGPLGLAIAAHWLRTSTQSHPDFETQKSQLAWAYNASCNAMSLATDCGLPHIGALRMRMWARLDSALLMSTIETLRTGIRTDQFETACETMRNLRVPRPNFTSIGRRTNTSSLADRSQKRKGRLLLQTIARIALDRYGLAQQEFEALLTIPSPDASRRVFYPFHVLSRPQARAMKWDWHHVFSMCANMITTMVKNCNAPAEKAGLGETLLDCDTLLYWMATFFCDKIGTIKFGRPGISQEELLWTYNLDRWGLPMVPWISHSFKVSLCKGPDHGIAMKFGFHDVSADAFDPVRHIDLEQSTVTLDSYLTNSGMYNFNAQDWDNARDVLRRVPLSNSFWNVDCSLGDDIWDAPSDESVVPQSPVIDVIVPLVPVENWASGEEVYPEPRCGECGILFVNFGCVLHHYQTDHSLVPDAGIGSNDSDDDGDDEDSHGRYNSDYWHDRTSKNIECLECEFTCRFESALRHHMATNHGGEKRHHCHLCEEGFVTKAQLAKHLEMAHGNSDLMRECSICLETFTMPNLLDWHIRSIHEEDPATRCPECPGKTFSEAKYHNLHLLSHKEDADKPYKCEDCGLGFIRLRSLEEHRQVNHGQNPCDKCEAIFPSKTELKTHQLATHSEDRKFVCLEYGSRYTTAGNLAHHMTSHSDDRPHKCPACSKSYKKKDHLGHHIGQHHSELHAQMEEEKALECAHKCTLCPKAFQKKDSLRRHMVQKHKDHLELQAQIEEQKALELPHRCTLCPKAYGNKSSLRAHVNSVHKKRQLEEGEAVEFSHKCTLCPSAYQSRNSLRMHMKRKHKEHNEL